MKTKSIIPIGMRQHEQIVLGLTALMLCLPIARAATLTLQHGVTPRIGGGTYDGTTDSWLDETYRNRNYGASHELCIKYDMNDEGFAEDHAILRFELPDLNFSSVNSATLEVFYFKAESFLTDNAMGIKPYRVDPTKPWFENNGGPDGKPNEGVSYSYCDQNQTQEWTAQYGGWYDKIDDGNGTNLIKKAGGTVPGAIEPGNWVPFDVRPSVVQWYGNATNNGFLLFSCYFTGAQSIVWGRFSSRDTNNPIYRPKLTIGYQGAHISWAGTVNGYWDTNSANWNVGGYAGLFGDGDYVTFHDGAVNTAVRVASGGVAPASVTISNSTTAYSFSGGTIGGSGDLTKHGPGQVTIANSNSYSGLTLINGGKLIVSGNGALGTTTAGTIVNSGATLGLQNVNYTMPEPLAIAGSGVDGTGALYASSGENTFGGTVLLNDASVIGVDPFATLTLTNTVTGNNDLTKTGAGTLIFAGSTPNIYNGTTRVTAGTLVLAKSAGSAVPGMVYIGGGPATATVRLNGHRQLGRGDVIVGTAGLLDLNNFDDQITGNLVLTNGTVTTGTGTLVCPGPITTGGDGTNIITGRLDLAESMCGINVADGASVDDLIISATVTSGGILKSGPGRLVLRGNNTFNGEVRISDGQVALESSSALGSTATGTIVNSGARLELRGGIAIGPEPLVLNGVGAGLGALYSATGNNSWAGQITLGAPAAIGVDSTATLGLSGPIDLNGSDLSIYCGGGLTVYGEILGTGTGITKTGPGVLTFAGTTPNTYTGTTLVSMGQLVLAKLGAVAVPGPITIGSMLDRATVLCMGDNQFGPNAVASIQPGSLLDLHGFNAHLAGLTLIDGAVETGTGTLELAGPVGCIGSSAATINGNIRLLGLQRVNVKAGTVLNIGATVVGGGFNKLGQGTLSLTGSNMLDTECTIEDGTVLVNNDPTVGFGLGPGQVTVTGRSILAGSGSICGPVHLTGGVLRPGSSIGTLIISNDLMLGSGSLLQIDAVGPAPGIDQIDLRQGGNLSIDVNAQLELNGTLEGDEPYIFIRGAQTVTGTFMNLPEGAEVPGQPGWYIHYGMHRVYFSRVQHPIVYFRAFSTNGVVLLMWRTGEEIATKWFDVYQWTGTAWLKVNEDPILPQSPTGAVYLIVNPHAHWNQDYTFKLVANTPDGEESWIFDRHVTEFNFSAFPQPTSEGVELRWLSRTDETYDLEWTDDIAQPLVPVLTNIQATPPECVVTHQTTNAQGFYRVRMVP